MFVYVSVNMPRSYENYVNSATPMKHPVFLLFGFILLYSCTSTLNSALAEISSIIEEHPDSALVMLQRIDCGDNYSDKVKAKYSLLYAMALDKNYIDICSDSIIQPALNYYSSRGIYDDRMKAYYYRGVVGRNKGDSEEAMHYYIMANGLVNKCKDYNAIGRLHNAIMNTYIGLYEYGEAFKSAEKAANAYMKAGNQPRYYDSLMDMLNATIIQNNGDDAQETCIRKIQDNWDNLSDKQRRRYSLIVSSIDGVSASMQNDLSNSFTSVFDDDKGWLVVAMQRYKDKDYIGLKEALTEFTVYCSSNPMENPQYLLLKSLLMENEGQYQESLAMLRRAVTILDDDDMKIFESDTKFLVERYDAMVKKRRLIQIIILLVISVFLIIVVSLAVIQSYKRKKAESENESLRYQILYRDALLEQEKLKRSRKDTVLGKDVRKMVNERLEVLNKFIMANISDTFSKRASEELQNLMSDREHFLESTQKSFIVAHPQFLMFLKQFDLSPKEIGYCCLYCIGLNGCEIANYLERKSIYNVSYALRRKMGLDRSTNLDTYLRAKMKELDREDSTF